MCAKMSALYSMLTLATFSKRNLIKLTKCCPSLECTCALLKKEENIDTVLELCLSYSLAHNFYKKLQT